MATEPKPGTYHVCKHGLMLSPHHYNTGHKAVEVPCPTEAYWHQHYLGHHPEIKE